jgi:hypothetical protein
VRQYYFLKRIASNYVSKESLKRIVDSQTRVTETPNPKRRVIDEYVSEWLEPFAYILARCNKTRQIAVRAVNINISNNNLRYPLDIDVHAL